MKRMARPKEVKEITGYEVGGLPPVGHEGLTVIVDLEVAKKNKVYGGGGERNVLLEISPVDIIRLTGAKVEDIS